MSDRAWSHRDLCEDLAKHLREAGQIAAVEMGIGSWGDHGQADVVAMKRSALRPDLRFYEVKVTRSDFLAELRSGKWERYRTFCERLYFATPRGLIDVRELPEGCGLMVRGPKAWRSLRAAKRSPAPREAITLRSLLLAPSRELRRAPRAHEIDTYDLRIVCRSLQHYLEHRERQPPSWMRGAEEALLAKLRKRLPQDTETVEAERSEQ